METGRNKYQFFSDFYIYKAEFESWFFSEFRSVCYCRMSWFFGMFYLVLRYFSLCHRILFYWFVVLIFCDNCIVDSLRNIAENIKRYLRSDIEELAILSDSQIGQTINRFMDKFFYLVIFYGL